MCVCFSQDSQGYTDDGSFKTSANQRYIAHLDQSDWLCAVQEMSCLCVCVQHTHTVCTCRLVYSSEVWWAGAAIHNICKMHNTEVEEALHFNVQNTPLNTLHQFQPTTLRLPLLHFQHINYSRRGVKKLDVDIIMQQLNYQPTMTAPCHTPILQIPAYFTIHT